MSISFIDDLGACMSDLDPYSSVNFEMSFGAFKFFQKITALDYKPHLKWGKKI